MKILYVGDVMGEPGLRLIERELPRLRNELSVDIVVAQAENVSSGKGVTLADFGRLKKAGVDFCTGGNWSLHQEEIIQAMNDPAQPIVRPANYLAGTPGVVYKYLNNATGSVLVVSLLGKIVGRDAEKPVDNPLLVIDAILEKEKDTKKVATVVNFHGDFSSEKFIIGRYLDGRASLVVGDHWHVPTADAMVLPNGTAHITDVGMVGTLDSCLGVKTEVILERWKNNKPSRNELETGGRLQFNAVLADVDVTTGLANSIRQIREIYDR